MTTTIAWVHVGDLHLDARDGWQSLARLREIVALVNDRLGDAVDFVVLPGDNANHGRPDEYRAMIEALAPLRRPWRTIPGDHDGEPGTLDTYRAFVPEANRPEAEVVAGHRCVYLDIVSAGAGGPDFRLTMHHRNRLLEELARANAAGEVPLVFMHAYPADLAADGEELARAFADAGVAFVGTGHTHYNEILNDGRVIYGAVRSTGEIEEDGGAPGFALVAVHDGVPSVRFRRLDAAWPHVQIVAPCDLRLVTRPADRRQVSRPGEVAVAARLFGAAADAEVVVRVDDGPAEPMRRGDGLFVATVRIDAPGLHRIEVAAGDAADRIDHLVRPGDAVPKRRPPVAPGHPCHAVGAWPATGIDGAQLGPNRNGRGW